MDWGLHLHEEFYDDLVFYPGFWWGYQRPLS